ncbi:hypothetical protein L6452_22100 [Arctium lappa]|uniref:Uncharacterized protein n=1 Tax=Arctium lappa TaxID=4217 RepID=A0ACB9AYX1_ARCLA|nr:hypothetical protein L6452_22100 [Arctium lappa]
MFSHVVKKPQLQKDSYVEAKKSCTERAAEPEGEYPNALHTPIDAENENDKERGSNDDNDGSPNEVKMAADDD